MTMAELEMGFAGNTCRCTGYRPILDTIKTFAVDTSADLCQKIRDIEDVQEFKCKKDCQRKCSTASGSSDWSVVEDLSLNDDTEMITLDFGNGYFVKVFDVNQIFSAIEKYNTNYILIDGDTSKGVFQDFEYPPLVVDISDVASLKKYSFDQNLVLGANISLEDCIQIFKNVSNTDEFKYLVEFASHLQLVANYPVRSIGSLAGNFMIKYTKNSYQSDLFLLFESVGATIEIRDSSGTTVSMPLTKFLSYDMTKKLITSFMLPPLSTSHVFRSVKIMPRSQNALAIVNAAFNFKFNGNNVENATIVYGNISGTFNHPSRTEQYLAGKNVFNNTALQEAIAILDKEIVPDDEPPEVSPKYRKKLAIGLFYKYILGIYPHADLPSKYKSGGTQIYRPVSKGTQSFQTNPTLYPLNEAVPKYEAIIQSSGEARYVNDIPPMKNEVFAAFVLSTVFNGTVSEVDGSEVLQIPGVIAVYSAKDIPGKNSFAMPGYQLETEDEQILAETVQYYGQPVAIVVADNEILAVNCVKKVKVTYTNVRKGQPVLQITQATKDANRYLAGDSIVATKKGDNITKIVKGTFATGAQYHYYMEPLSCVVIPVDQGLQVYDTTQWMDLTQTVVANCLKMKESDIHVAVSRLGGGFGGKISRNCEVAAACALVAKLLNVPCRMVLPLNTNLTIAGRRLPCNTDYEVGVDDDGKIQYLNAKIVEDDGCTHNENILSFTMSGFPNCYDKDYINLSTGAVTTDLPSNTYARAPGTMEGIASIEQIMEHIAFAVQKDPTDVRLINMRKEDNDLPDMIATWKKETDYESRQEDIKKFNRENRWKKKAIKLSVMAFPVEYYGNYSAMVSIYRGDGTVTVTTGGIEMGQGVNTKVAQVVAHQLSIPLSYVTVLASFSFVAANNVFSGSSIVSESVCYSAIKCCGTLLERLKAIRELLKKEGKENPTWHELITKAGEEEIDLTATYMMNEKEPDLQSYPAFAVVVIEVTLDVLTGKFQIDRVDILEDVGLSANPNVDIGQVEGGYIQGLSYYTVEKFVYDQKTGKLLTNNGLNYDVFLCRDIPVDMRVKLRYNSDNPKGVLGSKAVGEMGVCTAHSIIHALRQCIYESRKDSGYDVTQWINIDVPYTTESILKALEVDIKEFTLS
ncbi:indole-3-acetaldehyde oxidase-like isoform X2 [Aricia agestis]|nr:indole-3-acetaldehyde oxidase-like isoform X2 [Aricia agestis]